MLPAIRAPWKTSRIVTIMIIGPIVFLAAVYACIGFPIGASNSDVLDFSTATATLRQLRTNFIEPRSIVAFETAAVGEDSPLENATDSSEESPLENQTDSSEASDVNVTPRSASFMESPPQNETESDLADISVPTVTTVSTCQSGSCMTAAPVEPSDSEAVPLVRLDTDQQEAGVKAPQLEAGVVGTPEAGPNDMNPNARAALKTGGLQLVRSESEPKPDVEPDASMSSKEIESLKVHDDQLTWLEAPSDPESNAGPDRIVQIAPALLKAPGYQSARVETATHTKLEVGLPEALQKEAETSQDREDELLQEVAVDNEAARQAASENSSEGNLDVQLHPAAEAAPEAVKTPENKSSLAPHGHDVLEED